MKKYLIVGLGNIGNEYQNTRHNIGFKILNFIAKEMNVSFETVKLGDLCIFKFKGRIFMMLKPSTYMNLSGKAVNYWLQKEKIDKQNILVITDDIALNFGTIRLKGKGSNGGHNGLGNIQQILQTTQYPRFRFGVGSSFAKGKQSDYVLGKWTDEELQYLSHILPKTLEIIKSFGTIGLDKTMNSFNGCHLIEKD